MQLKIKLATPKPISKQKTKFNYAIRHLPPNTPIVVRDIIIRTDQVNLYQDRNQELLKDVWKQRRKKFDGC